MSSTLHRTTSISIEFQHAVNFTESEAEGQGDADFDAVRRRVQYRILLT